MINAVGINTVSTPSQTSPQPQVSHREPVPVRESEAAQSFISSRIRMDNLLDLAILEVRASDTGDVIRQFPTEQQIRAFESASEVAQASVENTNTAPVETPSVETTAPSSQPVSTNATANATNAAGTGSSSSILV